ELQRREDQRDEEADGGDDPDHQCAWPGCGRRGDPSKAEGRDDVEKQEIAETQRTSECRDRVFAARGGPGRHAAVSGLERPAVSTNRVSNATGSGSGNNGSPGSTMRRVPSASVVTRGSRR